MYRPVEVREPGLLCRWQQQQAQRAPGVGPSFLVGKERHNNEQLVPWKGSVLIEKDGGQAKIRNWCSRRCGSFSVAEYWKAHDASGTAVCKKSTMGGCGLPYSVFCGRWQPRYVRSVNSLRQGPIQTPVS